jgi:hypothetical protein
MQRRTHGVLALVAASLLVTGVAALADHPTKADASRSGVVEPAAGVDAPPVDLEDAAPIADEILQTPFQAPEPKPMASQCEEDCLSAWGACLESCPEPPDSPEAEACRADCRHDKILCLRDCWCCIFPGFP